MRIRKRLGDMLIEAGFLTQEQLEQALENKKRTDLKLGQFLVREGIVREEQLVNTLSDQLGLERYFPDKFPIDVGLTSVIPADFARKYEIAPLQKQTHFLVIAMADPTDINSLDAVEELTTCEVEPVICMESEMNELISSIYGVSGGEQEDALDLENMEFGTDAGETPQNDDLQVDSLASMAEGAPVVRMVNWIIAQAVRESASDIHISPERSYVQLRFRVDGRLKEVPAPPKRMALSIVSRIKILSGMDISITRVPQDGRFTAKIDGREINIRASSMPTVNGENMVLRLLDMSTAFHALESLGICARDRERLESIIVKPYGMILSTGPTGSGKTTTLYSVLRKLNQPDVNIITVEDPVEYRLEKIRQVQLNARAGMTFASGLRAILRQDPDVIMVGEIRDAETATIAVQAALTGHRVLSTVHTNNAAGAITRLIDMGIEPVLLSSVLLVAIAQRLVRRVCPHCHESYTPSPETLAFWGLTPEDAGTFCKSAGCHLCMHTGVLPYSPRCSSQVGVSAFTVMGYVFGCVVCETLTSRLS
ncbi:MAG: Flp pilus assembly complex ATPase component TadA [Planctomycetes bacterium]|nr:Flp pilus assembly complex ATPase component TadA [Planctomycetota bacterium]